MPETKAVATAKFAGFTPIDPSRVVIKSRAGAGIPADALAALETIHRATLNVTSDYFATPGDTEQAKKRWLRGLRAAAADLRATDDKGAEVYPLGRKLVVAAGTDGAPVWLLGGAIKPRKPRTPKS